MENMLVYLENGKTLTTSLQVAEVFEKEHFHILRDIENLECSEEFTASNFGLSSYTDASGKSNPMYTMTRDGWIFLAMGFTGARAAAFKEAYIKAFNKMEHRLKYPPVERLYIRSNRNYISDRPLGALLAEWLEVYTEPCGFQKPEMHPSILADIFNGWLVTSGYKREAKTKIIAMMPNQGKGLAVRKEMRG